MKRILLSAMLAVAVAALLTPATFAQEHATLIKNATVLTVTRGTIEGAKMSGTVSLGPFTSDFTGKRPDGGQL